MGLDITAYRKLEEVRPAKKEDDDYYTEGLCGNFYNQKAFAARGEGVKEKTIYRAAQEFGFRAGSYSGYNAWRDWLASLAGYGRAEDAWKATSGPFWELINFSDCEGVIGPVVAAKLAKDFAKYDKHAKAAARGGEDYYYEKYKEWRKAMEMAADGGAVDFH